MKTAPKMQTPFKKRVQNQKLAQLWKISTGGQTDFFHLCCALHWEDSRRLNSGFAPLDLLSFQITEGIYFC